MLARLFIALIAALSPPLASAGALDYPVRPVRILVGFTPGGATDTVARLMADWLSQRLGQPVIVENKPGAGSNIATNAVVGAAPDGYTLLFVSSAAAINVTANTTLPFDFARDIAPVAGLTRGAMVMTVHPSVPANTVAEFIAYAKQNPGKINVASPGAATTVHLAGELFRAMTGVDLVHVQYRGSAPALTDLLGGRVQAMFDVTVSVVPHIRAGKLRALGVTKSRRIDVLPDVPPIGETVSGYEAVIWFAIGAPKGTPPEVVEKLNREITAGLADAKMKASLADIGMEPMPLGSAELGAFIATEIEKWGRVVKFAGVKVE